MAVSYNKLLSVATVQSDTPIVDDEAIQEIVSDFLIKQTAYSFRNTLLSARTNLFEGVHWAEDPEDANKYQLTLNYLRNIVLRYVAVFSRSPRPRVPIPALSDSQESQNANRREKFLLAIWPDLLKAWGDVEMCASKLGYGVLQVVWAPKPGQPETVNMGKGEEVSNRRIYTETPFTLRSLPPENFYPTYRTRDDPNDFLSVFRHDPGRLVADLEETYEVSLQATGMAEITGAGIVSTDPTCDLIEYWTRTRYVLIAQTRVNVEYRQRGKTSVDSFTRYVTLVNGENPYGRFPFWVLQNIRSDPREDPTILGSLSDLDDVSDLNKHYNEMISEEAEEIAINIHRPIVYYSREHLSDPASIEFKAGAVFPAGPFDEERLEPLPWEGEPTLVQAHIERILGSIKDLSFLGSAGFGQMEGNTTGIGFQIALSPMEQIVELKLPTRIQTLQAVCSFLLRCFKEKAKDAPFRGWVQSQYSRYGIQVEVSAEEVGTDFFVEIQYGNLLPRDDFAHAQNEVYKYKTGVQSLVTTLDNLGFDDPAQEVQRIKAELSDPVLNPESAMLIAQAKQSAGQQPQPTAPTTGQMPQQTQMPPGAMQGQGQGQMPASPIRSTGPSLPGSAQPGTMPVNPDTFGGMRQTQPPVPMQGEGAPPGMQDMQGPGQLAPFLGRAPAKR